MFLFETGGYVNCIYKLSGLEVSPGVKKSLVFRTFDVKFNAEGFMRLYVKSEEKPNAENGVDAELAGKASNGLNLSNAHKQEEAKENGVNGEVGKANGQANVKANGQVNGKVNEENEKANGQVNGVNEETGKGKPFSIFSRLTEYMIMNEVSKYGLCQPVYAKYQVSRGLHFVRN